MCCSKNNYLLYHATYSWISNFRDTWCHTKWLRWNARALRLAPNEYGKFLVWHTLAALFIQTSFAIHWQAWKKTWLDSFPCVSTSLRSILLFFMRFIRTTSVQSLTRLNLHWHTLSPCDVRGIVTWMKDDWFRSIYNLCFTLNSVVCENQFWIHTGSWRQIFPVVLFN